MLSVLVTSQQFVACGGSGIQAGSVWVHRSEHEETALPATSPVTTCLLWQVKEARQY